MNIHRYYAAIIVAICLMGLCSCSTRHAIEPALPGEVSFTRDGYVRVKLHLENGKELDCRLDTGSPFTILGKDLEPELGERVGSNIITSVQGAKTHSTYQAPKLYLGGTALLTDDVIYTGNDPTLGMDILGNYCIQLDFTSNKMRFLDPNHLDVKDLGQAFPLTFDDEGCAFVHTPFLGVSEWVVDTGNPFDIALQAQSFDRVLCGREFVPVAVGPDDKTPYSGACLAEAEFAGTTFTDLFLSDFLVGNFPNSIGLPLLSRYLVTFNYPKGVMYLKLVTTESPLLGALLTEEAKTFLKSVAEQGELPGWSKGKGKLHWKADPKDTASYPASRIFKFENDGPDSATAKTTCQYSVIRESKDTEWKLQRAWRSDASGRVVEEYSVR